MKTQNLRFGEAVKHLAESCRHATIHVFKARRGKRRKMEKI